MAVYFLTAKVFSRSRGSRITKAAAYRAGERIHDDRTSECHNYSHRQDVVVAEIALPSQLAGRADMEWARNRSVLWNAAEHTSDRRNGRLGREVLVILPPELAADLRSNLVRRFAHELADRYQCAQLTNEALRDAGLETRIDHRSYKDQGINREPTGMMPQRVYYHEKTTGRPHPVGEQMRARRRERIEARLRGGDELAKVVARQKAEGREQILSKARRAADKPKKIPHGALTREERLQTVPGRWQRENVRLDTLRNQFCGPCT